MTPTFWIAGVMWSALVLYFLLGGADFGGGVWDFAARGPRKSQQRELIAHAIGPVWEANHVWLILVVVLLFGGFPRAFSVLSISLHLPLTFFLLGVVFRGSAFAFRSADVPGAGQRRWGLVFSLASVVSPMLLGMIVGAIASGRIRMDGTAVEGGYLAPWLQPFCWVTGLFSLSLCALVAATYLAKEATEPELKEDFRRRGLGVGITVGLLALLAFLLSKDGAPRVHDGLTSRPWTWPFHACTGIVALWHFGALWTRRYGSARLAVSALTALILLGWVLAQYPYLIVPDVTLENAAANPRTQRALLWALGAGVPVLGPSLWLLFRVFKRSDT
jgi:cytochrome bd ubiquinol oxidase subunit II